MLNTQLIDLAPFLRKNIALAPLKLTPFIICLVPSQSHTTINNKYNYMKYADIAYQQTNLVCKMEYQCVLMNKTSKRIKSVS